MIESHAGKVKPLNGALVIIASYHFSIGDLVAQAVCWLVRVNRKVWGRSFPLCFSLGSIFSILVIPLPPRSLIVGLFSLCDFSNSSTWLSTCLVLFSTSSTI
uniref:Uncharacterized protein n=2 Tax=Accipitrinae TaxID=8955 RepID=A0A8C0C4A6_9AVES